MTYADVVVDVLRLFDGPGYLMVGSRPGGDHVLPSISGSGTSAWFEQLLRDRDITVTLTPARGGGRFEMLPVVYALWRPESEFSGEPARYNVTRAGQHRVQAALNTMPAPSVVVDAGPAVWAGWCLEEPITSENAAREALATLAIRLGADVAAAADPRSCSLPLAGKIRDWNQTTPESIAVLSVHGDRRFTLAELVNQGDSAPAPAVAGESTQR